MAAALLIVRQLCAGVRGCPVPSCEMGVSHITGEMRQVGTRERWNRRAGTGGCGTTVRAARDSRRKSLVRWHDRRGRLACHGGNAAVGGVRSAEHSPLGEGEKRGFLRYEQYGCKAFAL